MLAKRQKPRIINPMRQGIPERLGVTDLSTYTSAKSQRLFEAALIPRQQYRARLKAMNGDEDRYAVDFLLNVYDRRRVPGLTTVYMQPVSLDSGECEDDGVLLDMRVDGRGLVVYHDHPDVIPGTEQGYFLPPFEELDVALNAILKAAGGRNGSR